MRTWLPKTAVTVGALAIAATRMLWPDSPIDAITLGLLVVAVLPWLSTLIKSAELPGGFKIEFQDVQAAGAKVTESQADAHTLTPTPAPSHIDMSERDPNLALVGLRIEIEKRLRALAERHGLDDTPSISRIVLQLRDLGVLNDPSVSGLQELVMAGNQAAHGASVDPRAAAWAIDYGPQVLAVLERKLHE
jgi:hypothetical protein